jgi:LPXTG-site transpeptidase (sortase) family protein
VRIKRHIDFRKVFASAYAVVAFSFITIGLQPAEAIDYDISTTINIPSINLVSSVTELKLKDHRLETPDTIVGSYSRRNSNRTLLVGHSTTVFSDLNDIRLGDIVAYGDKVYVVEDITTKDKTSIDMNELLRAEEGERETLVIMTCAGEIYENGDASHRLLVTARLYTGAK